MWRGSPPLTPAPPPGAAPSASRRRPPARRTPRGAARRSACPPPGSRSRRRSPARSPRPAAEPGPRALPTAPRISSGAIHCPFLTFTGKPVPPPASSRSVWRQRKAGICSTSTTSAAAAHCPGSWMSVSRGSPVSARTRSSRRSPSSIPGPRGDPGDFERFALSNEALKTTGRPSSADSPASASPTARFRSSSSRTQGPAIRVKRPSSPNSPPPFVLSYSGTLGSDLRAHAPIVRAHRRQPLEWSAPRRRAAPSRRRTKEGEERVRVVGARLELRVRLAPHEPGVLRAARSSPPGCRRARCR
jgi:hypothetical protein